MTHSSTTAAATPAWCSARLALRQSLDQRRVTRALQRRLAEKIDNYEREATKLDIRGQFDAAKVLRRAATNLRSLTNGPAGAVEAAR